MRQHLMVGLAALVAAAAGSAWAERCAPDASFAAMATPDCKGGHHNNQGAHSFDALAAVTLHARGKGLQQADEHVRVLNAVPEPGTIALLIAGLAAIGYRLVRRKI